MIIKFYFSTKKSSSFLFPEIFTVTSLVDIEATLTVSCNVFSLFHFTWQLLGTPTESDLGFIRNEDSKRYLRQLPPHPRQPLATVFPHVHPLAIDLVDKMLTFDPTKRITGKYLSNVISLSFGDLDELIGCLKQC